METSKQKYPWYRFYGDVPAALDYSKRSMSGEVFVCADRFPNLIAYNFLGKKTSYKAAKEDILICARGLKALGVEPEQCVTVCLPNCPQAVTIFYAINAIGAIANMVHPLSAEKEIEFYLNDSKSVAAITLKQFYSKFERVRANAPSLEHMLIADIKDALPPVKKQLYPLTKDAKKIPELPKGAPVVLWNELMALGRSYSGEFLVERKPEQPAVTLYSGGTTGTTKGIMLSNLNFNALGAQIIAMNPMFKPGDKMLAIMPMFHGFGLGVSIHSMLVNGGSCILVPQFTPKTYSELLAKHKPNFIAGVPTLFEALLRIDGLERLDLSCLKGVFSGGDSLSTELKKKFDRFLAEHRASITVREGYGTTECVTASCLTPVGYYKEGSIGIPFPDTFYKIVKPGTTSELPYGEEGEICLAGPSVMLGYVNRPEENAATLQKHGDGLTWVHTGDLGFMDEDGFIYFKQRMKRMIVSSGYNIYPSQLENVLEAHDAVHLSCVIGVKDPYRMQRVKAFIVLKPGFEQSEETKQSILEHCSLHLAKYAMPRELEFRAELPKTLVGKVAYRVLEEEEAAKQAREEREAGSAAAAVLSAELIDLDNGAEAAPAAVEPGEAAPAVV